VDELFRQVIQIFVSNTENCLLSRFDGCLLTESTEKPAIDAIKKGAKISDETANSLKNVSERTQTINQLIGEITSASESEAEGITQISVGMDQISSVVQSNTATAEESAAASEELSGQAQILNDLMSKFILKENE